MDRPEHPAGTTAQAKQKRVTLVDGTLVRLNTASVLNLQYNGEQRLLAGEIFIITATCRASQLKSKQLLGT